MIPSARVTRYVAPLREGGSLPGLVEADDLGTYVCKFRGAGQGLRVLIAEVIAAELVRGLGVRTPRLVVLELTEAIARYEADEEVQDLLTASLGLNLGVDFLPGSFGFDQTVEVAQDEATRILWIDAFLANVDRSWRNPNLLVWHGDTWLIDHGASLYFHHGWTNGPGDPARFAVQPWDLGEHVFAEHAAAARAADPDIAAQLTDGLIGTAVDAVPEDWLAPGERDAYAAFLRARRDGGRPWLPGGDA